MALFSGTGTQRQHQQQDNHNQPPQQQHQQQHHVESNLQPQEENDDQDDVISSPPGLWLPATVVKRNRKIATGIWLALLIIFFAYVIYMVFDGIQQRQSPAASIEVKEEVFHMPDVAVCIFKNHGCYVSPGECMETGSVSYSGSYGFDNNSSTGLEPDEESLDIQNNNPECRVIPTSKLEPNWAGIQSGEIRELNVMIMGFWFEGLNMTAEPPGYFAQAVGVSFIDISAGAKAFANEPMDIYLPYSRIHLVENETFSTTESHVMLTLTEFTGLSKRGKEKKTQKTFVQRTTSLESHFYWSSNTFDRDVAFLLFTMHINKFEFSSIKEVDPVDAWTIIGTIGGVWQFVVIGFGLFFVFAEKQMPEYKLRNFKKTIRKPISVAHRLSGITLKTPSTQDVILEAAGEDLPGEWIKRQRPDGCMYYHNTNTGLVTDISPHDLDPTIEVPTSSPGLRAVNQGKTGGDPLPAGWVERTAKNGQKYYMNTWGKYTQWKRPTPHPAPSSGSRGTVHEVDAPRISYHRSQAFSNDISSGDPSYFHRNTINTRWSRVPRRPCDTPRTMQGAAAAVNAGLPEKWRMKETADGKIYYVNHVTKQTQWQHPTC